MVKKKTSKSERSIERTEKRPGFWDAVAEHMDGRLAGRALSPEELLEKYPEHAERLRAFLAEQDDLEGEFQGLAAARAATTPRRSGAPADGADRWTLQPGERFANFDVVREIQRWPCSSL